MAAVLLTLTISYINSYALIVTGHGLRLMKIIDDFPTLLLIDHILTWLFRWWSYLCHTFKFVRSSCPLVHTAILSSAHPLPRVAWLCMSSAMDSRQLGEAYAPNDNNNHHHKSTTSTRPTALTPNLFQGSRRVSYIRPPTTARRLVVHEFSHGL